MVAAVQFCRPERKPHAGATCNTMANTAESNPLIAKIKASKTTRRKREIALLMASVCLAAAALIFREPFLVLISVFPALASYSQR